MTDPTLADPTPEPFVSGYGSLNGSGPQQVWTSNVRTGSSASNNTSTYSYEVRYYGNGYGSWGNNGSWSFTAGSASNPYHYSDGTFTIPQSDAFKQYTVLKTGSYTVSHNSSGVLAAFNVRGAIAYNHSSIGTGEVNLTEPAPPNITRVPATPAVPTLTEPTPVGMRVTWVAPASNGSAITAYDVQWSPNADMTGGTIVTVGNVLTTVLTGMPPQKLHYVRVRAVNARGASTYSGTKSLSTLPAGPPGLAVATSPSGTSATLTFSPPGGVTGVTKYTWERRLNGTTTPVATGESTVTIETITGLTPGSTYDWRASAWIGTYQSPWVSPWVTLKQAKPNIDPGDYFDGDTTDTADLNYDWTGTEDASTSTATASGVAGWSVSTPGNTGAVLYRVTAGIVGSTFAARVQIVTDMTAAGQLRAGQANTTGYRTEVTADASYVGSIYVHPSRSQSLAAELTWVDAAGSNVGQRVLGAATNVPGGTWLRLAVGAVAPAGAAWAVVRVTDVAGTGWSNWLGGDVLDLDAAMISLNEEFPYFDGSTLYDGTYVYEWTGESHASTSTRTPAEAADASALQARTGPNIPGALALVDPDCTPVPAPPRPPSIPSDCIENVGVWRRYFTDIPANLVPDWMDVVPTVLITTGSSAARQVRIRYYPNPDELASISMNTATWMAEQIISYMPAQTTMTLDGITQRVWAEVKDGAAVAADHLLYGTNGQPATWPLLSCGIAYMITVDVPINEPSGNVSIDAALTART
jgi:hypothetical protein